MTKSSHAVLGLLPYVLLDMRREFQGLSCTIDTFESWLMKLALTRGRNRLLLLELPALGKVFDKGLSSGRIPNSSDGINLCYHPGKSSPLSRMLAQLFDSTGYLYDCNDPTYVFFMRTIFYAHKKVKLNCPIESVQAKVEGYISNDQDLRQPNLPWGRAWNVPYGILHAPRSFALGTPNGACPTAEPRLPGLESEDSIRVTGSNPGWNARKQATGRSPLLDCDEAFASRSPGREDQRTHEGALGFPAECAPGDDYFPVVRQQGDSAERRMSLISSRRSRELEETRGHCGTNHTVPPRVSQGRTQLDRVLSYLRYVCDVTTPQAEVPQFGLVPRHGPGAVSDAQTGTDKYQFKYWPLKLGEYFDEFYYRTHRDTPEVLKELCETSKLEPPGRLLAVPKDFSGPRLITAEPTAHQFLQQGLLSWLRQNLTPAHRTCIDFRSQTRSQLAAQKASIDGIAATIDLKSASDRLSCWTVERVFASNPSLLSALNAARTSTVTNGTNTGPKFSLRLRKFAGQGSAVTFPVQSMVYANAAIAAVMASTNSTLRRRSVLQAARKVRVFGDDIVLPSSSCPELSLILSHLELQVNLSKSHTTGNFRESCGGDYFEGYDVTPLYFSHFKPQLKRAETMASWVEVSNNAHRKGLWITARKMGQAAKPLVRSVNVPQALSLFSFLPYRYVSGRGRYDHELQGVRYFLPVVRTWTEWEERSSHDSLLQYFLEKPEPDSHWQSGFMKRNAVQIRKAWVTLT